jgi:hypothetical protein
VRKKSGNSALEPIRVLSPTSTGAEHASRGTGRLGAGAYAVDGDMDKDGAGNDCEDEDRDLDGDDYDDGDWEDGNSLAHEGGLIGPTTAAAAAIESIAILKVIHYGDCSEMHYSDLVMHVSTSTTSSQNIIYHNLRLQIIYLYCAILCSMTLRCFKLQGITSQCITSLEVKSM